MDGKGIGDRLLDIGRTSDFGHVAWWIIFSQQGSTILVHLMFRLAPVSNETITGHILGEFIPINMETLYDLLYNNEILPVSGKARLFWHGLAGSVVLEFAIFFSAVICNSGSCSAWNSSTLYFLILQSTSTVDVDIAWLFYERDTTAGPSVTRSSPRCGQCEVMVPCEPPRLSNVQLVGSRINDLT